MKKSKIVIGKTKQKAKSQNKVKTKKSNKSRKKTVVKTKPSINNNWKLLERRMSWKLSRTVWSGGKDEDNIKVLPITI